MNNATLTTALRFLAQGKKLLPNGGKMKLQKNETKVVVAYLDDKGFMSGGTE